MTQPPPKRRRAVARKWHRWLGLLSVLPLLWLAITGLLLNHADALGLHERQVKAAWILRHYHQLPDGEPKGLKVGDRLVSTWGELIFLDSEPLNLNGQLIGGEAVRGQLVIATDERIGIYDGTDEMLLDLDELSLPTLPLEKITVKDDLLFVSSEGKWWQFSEDFLSFVEAPNQVELQAATLPEVLAEEERAALVVALQTRRAMPLSRVILDSHSGKLFGLPGTVIYDLAAIGLIVLTILGLRLYPKRRTSP